MWRGKLTPSSMRPFSFVPHQVISPPNPRFRKRLPCTLQRSLLDLLKPRARDVQQLGDLVQRQPVALGDIERTALRQLVGREIREVQPDGPTFVHVEEQVMPTAHIRARPHAIHTLGARTRAVVIGVRLVEHRQALITAAVTGELELPEVAA